jgi:hypothetical protein
MSNSCARSTAGLPGPGINDIDDFIPAGAITVTDTRDALPASAQAQER